MSGVGKVPPSEFVQVHAVRQPNQAPRVELWLSHGEGQGMATLAMRPEDAKALALHIIEVVRQVDGMIHLLGVPA